MTDEPKRVPMVVDGRTLTVKSPEPDQLLAWMGLVSGLSGDLTDRDQDEINDDLTLIMDAILSLFEDPDERRWFRRASVLGKAKLSDVVQAVVDAGQEQAPTTGPKPKVRRAR